MKCLWEHGNKDIFIQEYVDEDIAYDKFIDTFINDAIQGYLNIEDVWNYYIRDDDTLPFPTNKDINRLVLDARK